jgi:hypothetical protein
MLLERVARSSRGAALGENENLSAALVVLCQAPLTRTHSRQAHTHTHSQHTRTASLQAPSVRLAAMTPWARVFESDARAVRVCFARAFVLVCLQGGALELDLSYCVADSEVLARLLSSLDGGGVGGGGGGGGGGGAGAGAGGSPSLPLQRLDLAGCNVTSAAMEALVKCARRLVSLRLSRCLNRQARCLDHRLILLTKFEFLEHLDISLTACLSDAVVWQLLTKLERLRSLNLASCDGLSDDAFVACRVASSHLCSLDVRYARYGSLLPLC